MINCHLDFETYSECDIKKSGGFVYTQHPSTEVICMAYAYDNDKPVLWLPNEPLPDFLKVESHGDFHLHCWNSGFEYDVISNVMNLEPAPLEFWTDTAALASVMSLPAALEKCGKAMGIPRDKAKDDRGNHLVKKSGLCKPVRNKRNTDPKLLWELYEYCIQDVIAERYIGSKLQPLSDLERQVWLLDQKINLRGMQIDIPNVEHAIEINEGKSAELMRELIEITGLENPNSWQQFLPWLQKHGYTGENLQADTLRDFLTELEK